MLNRSIAANSVFINPVNVLGWVVKSKADCYSFPVSQYGPQQQTKGDAGNGVLMNGTQLTSDCLAENVEWLKHVESVAGNEAMQKHRQRPLPRRSGRKPSRPSYRGLVANIFPVLQFRVCVHCCVCSDDPDRG
jgi:hypothetical protein